MKLIIILAVVLAASAQLEPPKKPDSFQHTDSIFEHLKEAVLDRLRFVTDLFSSGLTCNPSGICCKPGGVGEAKQCAPLVAFLAEYTERPAIEGDNPSEEPAYDDEEEQEYEDDDYEPENIEYGTIADDDTKDTTGSAGTEEGNSSPFEPEDATAPAGTEGAEVTGSAGTEEGNSSPFEPEDATAPAGTEGAEVTGSAGTEEGNSSPFEPEDATAPAGTGRDELTGAPIEEFTGLPELGPPKAFEETSAGLQVIEDNPVTKAK